MPWATREAARMWPPRRVFSSLGMGEEPLVRQCHGRETVMAGTETSWPFPVMARLVRATRRGNVVAQVARTSRAMTVGGRAMTVGGRAATVGGRSMTVGGRAMTVEGRAMTGGGRAMTVRGRAMTVGDRAMTVEGRSMT